MSHRYFVDYNPYVKRYQIYDDSDQLTVEFSYEDYDEADAHCNQLNHEEDWNK